MTAHTPTDDPVSSILHRHGAPRLASVAEDIAGTYRRIGDMLGVRRDSAPVGRNTAAAALHGELGALAMAAGDSISVREHFLTAARLSANGSDLEAMMALDAQIAVPPGQDSIYAIYDLSRGPITYDFTHFLALAEHFRRISQRTGLYVIFVPGPGDGFRRVSERDHFLDRDRKLWRLANLLAPCASLLPHCVGTTVCATREEAEALLRTLPRDCIFPRDYSLAQPSCPYLMPLVQQAAAQGQDIRAFRAPPLAAELVKRWFAEIAGAKPVVSITLRQSDFQPARNNDPESWRRFAEFCVEQGFHPVFVPDTEALLTGVKSGFEDFSMLDLPSLSVGYRMAVYQESFANMMVSNGPTGLCFYHPTARYLIYKILNPAISTCSATFLTAQGIIPGRQLPFAGPQQRLVWESDKSDALIRGFTALVEAVLAEPADEVVAAAS